MKSYSSKITIILAILFIMPLSSCASDKDRGGRQQGPPPEAIKACEGKSSGDSVTFTGRRGESLQAVCQEIEGQLAAVPEGMERGGPKKR